MTIFRQERDSAILPVKVHSTDSGYDLFTPTDFEMLVIQPMQTTVIDTGILVDLPEPVVTPEVSFYFEGQVRSKSGRAAKEQLKVINDRIQEPIVLNDPGSVDYTYPETLKVILINLGEREITIEPAQKIAQFVVAPILGQDNRGKNTEFIVEPRTEKRSNKRTSGLGSTGLSA